MEENPRIHDIERDTSSLRLVGTVISGAVYLLYPLRLDVFVTIDEITTKYINLPSQTNDID
ncbi:MAG: hypothetical protein H6822_20725 [Planctomycetaceae bacterium]|nr:hypothetical protein [Planctomycetales bacterium]MCB9924616.1 hypothetical protein [Planctomycetaceae bacterium]